MDVDLSSSEMRQNPYPTYAQFRQQQTAVFVTHEMSGKNQYFLTRYDDIVAVLKDDRFVNDVRRLPSQNDWTKNWYVPPLVKTFMESMALVDEPDHTRLRQLVHKAFTPSRVQKMQQGIEQITAVLLNKMAHKKTADLIADFAQPLPLTVIGDMMGIPERDRQKFGRWLGDNITNASGNEPLRMIPKLFNAVGLMRFLRRLVRSRKRTPTDDLTTALVQAEEAGDRLSENELLAMLMLILFAGHDTTVNLIGNGLLALLQHPDQLALLRDEPDLLDSAIEELLRFTNPVQHIAQRYTLEEVTIGGLTIPAHSTVLLGIAAANRDEAIFREPDRLDIQRKPNRHIAFGLGVHYCLGAPLARMEAKIAFRGLLEQFPNMRLATPADALRWHGAPALRGLRSLPIELN